MIFKKAFLLKLIVSAFFGLFSSSAFSATSTKNARVYCLSEDRISTRMLFFFDAANTSGQALVSVYQGPRMAQQKVRWQHTQDDTLVGLKGPDEKLFELTFESFGSEGGGTLYLQEGAVQVSCSKI